MSHWTWEYVPDAASVVGGLTAAQVDQVEGLAARIADALTMSHPKVRYQITPDPMRHVITALLPKRMVDRIIAKRLGLLPPA